MAYRPYTVPTAQAPTSQLQSAATLGCSSTEDAEPGSEAALAAIGSALNGFSSQYSLLGTEKQHVLGAGSQGTVLRSAPCLLTCFTCL